MQLGVAVSSAPISTRACCTSPVMSSLTSSLILPLSLRDTCMLYVLFRVNELPVESLALLPRAMRRLLLHGLPRADILHLGDAALFSDLEELEQTLLTAREDLLDAVLYGNLK